MKDLKEIIASNISDLRNEAGMTQMKLAQLLNYSDKAVSKWERAESVPDIVVLKHIADCFDVSVDYLLCEEHEQYKENKRQRSRAVRKNNLIITGLSVLLVWFVATFIFVELNLLLPNAVLPSWIAFIYAVPVSLTVFLIFNSIWGKKRLNYLIISAMIWTGLLAFYLSSRFLTEENMWLVFILGIPSQMIVFLWSGLKKLRSEV